MLILHNEALTLFLKHYVSSGKIQFMDYLVGQVCIKQRCL